MDRPTPGQKWSISELSNQVDTLMTLVGTVGANAGTPATPSMSLHLYRLKENQEDLQSPHKEEELYYVLSGTRTLVVNAGGPDEVRTQLIKGDVVYVPSMATHRFVGPEEITLMVFFAPNFTG